MQDFQRRIMKEFILLVRAEGDPMAGLSPEQQQDHIRKVGAFIRRLTGEGRMIAAQPLEFNGNMISRRNGSFTDGPFTESKELIAGYYLVLANDLEEAIAIAKTDPRFEEGEKWRIEVRPILKVKGINLPEPNAGDEGFGDGAGKQGG
jgi:hypothetical protein